MAMWMNPYLVMNGNAREAVAFYAKALDAEVMNVTTFGEMPPNPEYPLPAEAKEQIMHALLKVGMTELMLSDTFPGTPHQSGDQVNIALQVDSADQAKKCFDALAEGGRVTLPFQAMPWSPGYGMVTDKFGVPWQVNTKVEA